MDTLVAKVNDKGVIEGNFEELEKQILEVAKSYKGVIVTEDNIKETKKDVAELNKSITSIENARKEIKKAWMVPYTEFETKCRHLVELLSEPVNEMKSQLEVFENARIEEKRKHIKEIYDEEIGEFAEYLPLDKIFNEKWLNASAKDKDILYDISEQKTKVKSAMDVIKSLNSEIEDELLKVYRDNDNDLAAAVKRNNDYMADKAKISAALESNPEPSEKRPSAESMGSLDETVNAFKTVKFTVSAADREEVETILQFNGISYQILEG